MLENNFIYKMSGDQKDNDPAYQAGLADGKKIGNLETTRELHRQIQLNIRQANILETETTRLRAVAVMTEVRRLEAEDKCIRLNNQLNNYERDRIEFERNKEFLSTGVVEVRDPKPVSEKPVELVKDEDDPLWVLKFMTKLAAVFAVGTAVAYGAHKVLNKGDNDALF